MRFATVIVHADTSRDWQSIGWSEEWLFFLTYIQDRGRLSSRLSFGWQTTKCHPLCSLGQLVWELTGGSCKARKEKLAMFASLKSELVME